MVNKVILIGNLGKDPEIKEFDNGSVANFSLATNETYKNRNGERITNTEWHNIRVGVPGLVELVRKYFKKGDPMYLEGKIKSRNYEKDGQTRYFTEIDVDTIKFLPKPKEGNNTGNGGYETQSNVTSSASADDFASGANDVPDDDLPF